MEKVPGTIDQPGNFLRAEDDRQPLEALWVGQILPHIPALQHLDVEEPKCTNLDDNCAVSQIPVFEQIDLIAAKIVRSQMIEPLVYSLAARLHRRVSTRRAQPTSDFMPRRVRCGEQQIFGEAFFGREHDGMLAYGCP